MINPPLKFKGKFRIPSNRLKGWDYGMPGFYFVTICTQNKEPWFGEIRGDQMILSPAGEIVTGELEKTPHIRPDIRLEAWVVMPNHIHAIIVVDEIPGVETPRRGVSTNKKNWRPGTLGAIINQYKSICTRRIRAKGWIDFTWQARFYDHIIRDKKSLENIHNYIIENPARWAEDEYFSDQ